jgi:hypothetical protein
MSEGEEESNLRYAQVFCQVASRAKEASKEALMDIRPMVS